MLKTISEGIRVNLRSKPQQPREPSELSWDDPSAEALKWLEQAISWESIEKVPSERIGESGELIHNLVSEEKKGCLCSNTRDLNAMASKLSVKMPSLKDVCQVIPKNYWLAKIDLLKFYWAMLIHPSHCRYFRFRIHGELFQWRALPFGYINSMQIMARIMDPVLTRIRSFTIEVTSWVDDIVLILDPHPEVAQVKLEKTIVLLEELGFIINKEKSSIVPSQQVMFRGFLWRASDLTIHIPQDKVMEWKTLAASILKHDTVNARTLLSLIGKVWYSAQLNPFLISWLVEMHLHTSDLVQRVGWEVEAPIPPRVMEELRHWQLRSETLPWPMRWSLEDALITKGDAGPARIRHRRSLGDCWVVDPIPSHPEYQLEGARHVEEADH